MNHNENNKEEDIVFSSVKNSIDTFLDFANIFLKFKKFIIMNLILGSIFLTLVAYFLLPKYYITKLSFIPPSSQLITSYSSDISDVLKDKGLNLFSQSSLLAGDPNDFWIEVLKSREINEYISKKFNLKEKLGAKYIEDTFDFLEAKVKFKVEKGIIKLEAETEKSEDGEKLANAYIEKLSSILNEINKSEMKNQKDFLEKRINKIHNELMLSSKKIAKFQTDNKILSVERQGAEVLDSITRLKSEIISLEAQLKALSETYTEKSTRVKSLKAQINSLKEKLEQLKGNEKNSNKDDFNILELPSANIDYIEITRDTKTLEFLFQTLTKEFEILKIKESKSELRLKILDKAKVSEKKHGKNKKLVALIGIIFLFIINIGFIFLIYLKEKLKENLPDSYQRINTLFRK